MNSADEPVFEEPWEARAFALAVALHERGAFTWSEWAKTLGMRIATAQPPVDGHGYYHHWLNALEDILVTKGVMTADETARWRQAWRRAAIRTPHGSPIEVRTEDFF